MNMDRKERILIILAAGIGDLVLSSCSIRAIRNGFPSGEIHLLTTTDARPIAVHYPYVDRVWALPLRELRKNIRYLMDIARVLFELRACRFDRVINLYQVASRRGAVRMGLLLLLLGGSENFGHGAYGLEYFLTESVQRDSFKNRHFADAMLTIAQLAGGIPDGRGIEVFWDRSSEERWKNFFAEKKPDTILVGLNPGADRKHRRWKPDHFAAVADRLKLHVDATILLFGGPGEERIALQIQDAMEREAVNLAGQLSLNDLVYFISRLDLLLTNDSGPMHIAAAVRTPLVALFGPEDPVLMGPCTEENLYKIVTGNIFCRPCRKDVCEQPDCMDTISPEEVLDKCRELLELHRHA